MERLEPTRSLALKVWWAFIWRCALGAIVLGFLIGLALGLLAETAGFGRKALGAFNALASLLVGAAVSVEMMYRVLNKKFRDFEIALVQRQE